MSLKDIRSECSDVAGLLQPYVDAELNETEQESVAAHLQDCSGCRAAVTEQAWVRSTLQSVERDSAPQALRAKVLLGLDEIDREHAAQEAAEKAASAPPSLGSRIWARLRDLGRGGLIMVPAGAVAIGLFYVARDTTPPPGQTPPAAASAPGFGLGSAILPSAEGHMAPGDEDLVRAIAVLEPQVGFRVQVPRAGETDSGLQLVGASLDSAADTPAARLRYQLGSGQHVIDRQVPAATLSPRGQAIQHSGRAYHLHFDEAGRPLLTFEVGGVGHVLVLEGATVRPDDRAEASPQRPDFDLLLKFAARLGSG